MKSQLAKVFDELLREVEANPGLRARIERHLTPHGIGVESARKPRPKNRRGPPALDPYEEIATGEGSLREKLTTLSVEQLKDIVSAFALDSSRLALKWKDSARLIDLIAVTVRNRIEKGDVFRAGPEQAT